MLRLLFLTLLLSAASHGFSQSGSGSIRGSVTNLEHAKNLEGCLVGIQQNGVLKGTALTDSEGKFRSDLLQPGDYEIEIISPDGSYESRLVNGVLVSADRITFVDEIILYKVGYELTKKEARQLKKWNRRYGL